MTKTRIFSLALVVLLVVGACRLRDATPTLEAAEETPLPTPSPTQSLAPTVAPTATPTPVTIEVKSSEELGAIAFDYVQQLTEEFGSRESATEEEQVASQFLAEELASMGYDVTVQQFQVLKYSTERPFLTIVGPVEEAIDARFLNLTGTGELMASLIQVSLGDVGDFPEEGLDGQVALIERGAIPFEDKVHNAQGAGASAAIIYNNEPGNFFGTLSTEAEIPALSVSQADGQHLVDLLDQGDVTLDVHLIRSQAPSQNVVASKVVSGFN
ncbi:MAG: PA domain-containing protein, partial [Dehalococcoidia bacterium]